MTEGYLVAPRAVDVPLKFQRGGIKYDDLSDEDKEKWDAIDWSEDDDFPDEISVDEINKFLFNKDTIDKTLVTLMTYGAKVEGGDRLGKTIIFARNNNHAESIAERFNALFPEFRGEFAQVITHRKAFAQNLIDKFSERDKAPHIAISVDMLDTGIDVPEVVNLVFAKLVRSKTKLADDRSGHPALPRPVRSQPGQERAESPWTSTPRSRRLWPGCPHSFGRTTTARRPSAFDLLALRLQLALPQADADFLKLRAQVQEIASALLDPTTLTIPNVRQQQEFLEDLTTDQWWEDVTLPMLENMRKRLRELVAALHHKRLRHRGRHRASQERAWRARRLPPLPHRPRPGGRSEGVRPFPGGQGSHGEPVALRQVSDRLPCEERSRRSRRSTSRLSRRCRPEVRKPCSRRLTWMPSRRS
ncbi:hypothetical protein ABH927_003742 [Planotetraspora sp. GP83]